MVSISSVSLGFLNDSFIFSIFIVFDKYTVLCTGDGSQGSNDRAVIWRKKGCPLHGGVCYFIIRKA